METELAILEVSRWSREIRANAIRVVARDRGSAMWGLPFLVQPKSWPSFYQEARRTRSTVAYAVVKNGEYEDIL